MIRIDNKTPVIGYGPLTLDDLALRADQAYADHIDTYTAVEVLHRAFMAIPDRGEDMSALIDAAKEFIRDYREKTHEHWRVTYAEWAYASGLDISPDLPDDPTQNGEV